MFLTNQYYCQKCKRSFWYTVTYYGQLPRCPKCKCVNWVVESQDNSFCNFVVDMFKRLVRWLKK